MAGDFEARITELQDKVGDGALTGKVEVDQLYSHYQHEGLDLRHPHGGQAKFLETALHNGDYFARIAETVLDGGAKNAMIDAVEKLDHKSAELTPKELTLLARSGHPTVTDAGSVVYDRPPDVPRLSEAELEELHDVINTGR